MRAETLIAILGATVPVLLAVGASWASTVRRIERLSASHAAVRRELRSLDERQAALTRDVHRIEIGCAACHGEASQHGEA